jgi:hypothetical protein
MPYVDLFTDAAAMRRIFCVARPGATSTRRCTHCRSQAAFPSGIYRVDLRSGSYCLKQALPRLKVAKDWRVPVDRVFAEIDYLRTVSAIAPGRVPQVIGQDDATKSFVMEFFGPEFRNWKAQLLAGAVDCRDRPRKWAMCLAESIPQTADRADYCPSLRERRQLFPRFGSSPTSLRTRACHTETGGYAPPARHADGPDKGVLVHGDVSPKEHPHWAGGRCSLMRKCAWFGDLLSMWHSA